MNHWITSSLIIGSTLLTACSHPSTNTLKAKSNAPELRSQTVATTREIKVAPPEFRKGAPERYIVQRGDTLWGIAEKFLKNPGRWQDIWHANQQIKNPHLIYPGDVISYTLVGGVRKLQVAGSSNPVRGEFTGQKTADGRPIYNINPSIQETALEEPIPTIPKNIVYPFMTKNLVMKPGFSAEKPYIIGQSDGNFISLTGREKVYAKTVGDFEHELYNVFREARPINNPANGDLLGIEAVYVGQLKLIEEANDDGVGTFMQVDSMNPLHPKDVLIPVETAKVGEDLNFLPKLSNFDGDEALAIRPLGAASNEAGGQFSTILINIGADDGVTSGDVFKIVRAKSQTGVGRDGETFRLPDYEVGMGIVYKTNDDTSYLLVMNAYDVVYPGDRLVRP